MISRDTIIFKAHRNVSPIGRRNHCVFPSVSIHFQRLIMMAVVIVSLLFSASFFDGAAFAQEPPAVQPAHSATKALIRSGSVVAVYRSEANPFNALVGKKRVRRSRARKQQRVQRYVISEGNREFLFQDKGTQARIQFLCGDNDNRIACRIDEEFEASEIYTLLPIRAPRGDVIYKDMDGHTILRIASYGGATVWWPGEKEARAASKSFSDRTEIKLNKVNDHTVIRRATRATALLSAITGEPILFETGIVPSAAQQPDTQLALAPESFAGSLQGAETEQESDGNQAVAGSIGAAVLADSVVMASKGMAAVAADPTGARVIGARLKRVRFVKASEPSMQLKQQVFLVSYNPALGLQGRPTSAEIMQFLEENL